MTKNKAHWSDHIRDIPDFPKPGIIFKDITPLLADGDAFAAAVSELSRFVAEDVDAIVGIESRGFIFGAALAQQLGLGLIDFDANTRPGPNRN